MSQSTSPRKWYAFKSAVAAAAAGAVLGASGAPEVLIYGDIGESWWSEDQITAKAFREELSAIQAESITVRILSLGGSVPDGLGIYNALKAHPAKITTINDGVAASIASLIFMAGDVRICAANSLFMIHAPWTGVHGNASALRAMADELDTWSAAMAASYVESSGKTKADVLALMADGLDHYFTAEEAVAEGWATQVGDAVDVQASAKFIAAAKPQMAEKASTAAHAILSQWRTAVGSQEFNPAPQGATPKEPVSMTKPTNEPQTTGAAPDDAAIVAARAAGVKAEADRRNSIMAACKPFLSTEGVEGIQAAALADPAATAEAVDKQILAAIAKSATPANAGRVVTTEDETDKIRAAAVQSIMARAGASAIVGEKAERVRADGANPLRGMTLTEVARHCLARAGVKTDGMDRMQIVAAAFTQSTSDFPILLENVMHKVLQAGYAVQTDTWSRFCARGSVSDFRAHSRYRVGSLGNLLSLTELAEFQNRTIPDGEKSSITAGTKGYLINISRQTVINDDLQAFVGLATAMGRAAKRTVEADVYATLALNSGAGPTLSDGKALFHVDHANLAASGAAPTVTTVAAGRNAMASQLDVGGNDYLGLTPAVALSGLTVGDTLRELNAMEFNSESNKEQRRPNVVRGLFRDLVSTPRVSGNAWMMFADPSEAPALEVAFLDGNDMPFLDQQTGWTVDGTSFKVRLDYGVAGIDYRGAYRNPGA